MLGGIGIGLFNANWVMFWVMTIGAVGIILYSSYTSGRQRRDERRAERRRKRDL